MSALELCCAKPLRELISASRTRLLVCLGPGTISDVRAELERLANWHLVVEETRMTVHATNGHFDRTVHDLSDRSIQR